MGGRERPAEPPAEEESLCATPDQPPKRQRRRPAARIRTSLKPESAPPSKSGPKQRRRGTQSKKRARGVLCGLPSFVPRQECPPIDVPAVPRPEVLYDSLQFLGDEYAAAPNNVQRLPIMTCYNTGSFISTMAATPSLVFVGVKHTGQPYDLFSVAHGKSGSVTAACVGQIRVLRVVAPTEQRSMRGAIPSLEAVDVLEFPNGMPVQLAIFNYSFETSDASASRDSSVNSSEMRLIGLFGDGTLSIITYRPPVSSKTRVIAASRDVFAISTDEQIIQFTTHGNKVAYTDGYTVWTAAVTKTAHGLIATRLGKSLPATTVISGMALVPSEGRCCLILMNRLGRLVRCNEQCEVEEELLMRRLGMWMFGVPEYEAVMLVEDDGTRPRLLRLGKTVAPWQRKQLLVALADGSVQMCHFTGGQTRQQRLLQMVPSGSAVRVCVEQNEFETYKSSRMAIAGLAEFDDFFVFALENGLVCCAAYNSNFS